MGVSVLSKDDVYTLSEGQKIKNEIFSVMPRNLDELGKARYLYLQLSRRLNYDTKYMLGDVIRKTAMYDVDVTFRTLDSREVICKSWSQLYREILIDAGFSPERVSIMGNEEDNSHKWVEISVGNYIIRADATCPFLGKIDISSTKYSLETVGFVFLGNKNLSGMDFRDFEKNKEGVLRLNEIIKLSNKALREVDKKIGYISNGKYRDEVIDKAKKSFFDPSSVKRLFGYDDRIDRIVSSFNNGNGSVLDGFYYFSRMRDIMFSEEERKKIDIHLMDRMLQNGELCLSTLLIHSDHTNRRVCRVFDEEHGGYVRMFANEEEVSRFIGEQKMSKFGTRGDR